MKTSLTFLILAFATLQSFSQVDSTLSSGKTVHDSLNQIITLFEEQGLDHFKFKEIPIDGSLNKFVSLLKNDGFEVLDTSEDYAILTGKFTGENVHILVQAGSKNVYGVTVIFEERNTWNSIKSQYFNMKSMLTTKYGYPEETIEKFDPSFNYEDLGMELLALSEDKCTYMANFATDTGNGMIRLSISSDANLVLNYVDSINYLVFSLEAYDDL